MQSKMFGVVIMWSMHEKWFKLQLVWVDSFLK